MERPTSTFAGAVISELGTIIRNVETGIQTHRDNKRQAYKTID